MYISQLFLKQVYLCIYSQCRMINNPMIHRTWSLVSSLAYTLPPLYLGRIAPKWPSTELGWIGQFPLVSLPQLYLRRVAPTGSQHRDGRKAALNRARPSARQPQPGLLTEKILWPWSRLLLAFYYDRKVAQTFYHGCHVMALRES